MSKLADALRVRKIYNNFGILHHWGDAKCVAIEYSRRPDGRLGACMTNHTDVWSPRPNEHLEKEPLSTTYRKRFFGKRSETYRLARNWAAEIFGHDYVPSPFGGLIPRHVKARAERFASTTPPTPNTNQVE